LIAHCTYLIYCKKGYSKQNWSKYRGS